MSTPGNFLRDIAKHIDKRHDLTRGDKEAWADWFDKLEFFSRDYMVKNKTFPIFGTLFRV